MRQFRTLAFTCAVAVSVLTACGSSGGNAQSPAGEASSVAPTTISAAGGSTSTAPTTSTAVSTSGAELTDHEDAADYTWNEGDVVAIALKGTSASSSAGSVEVSGSTVTIGAAGTYRLTGALTNGQIVVDTDDDGVVRLILNGVDITSASTSPISVTDAKKVVVILADNTQNRLTDAATYTFADATTDEPNAASFSTADLTIAGNGSLTVKGSFNDGIASKDGLVIAGGTIVVDAKDDGIRGKDYLVVKAGTITVRVTGDALKADNEEDPAAGFISITAGTFDLTSGGDAIQAATDVVVNDGTIKIKAGGGSTTAVAADASAKGIKGAASVTIAGGTFTIDSADDAIHSNASATVSGGTFSITTGDDGIHADATLLVSGGTVGITKSYEGIESAAITIAGGSITIVSSDDGVNAAGGVDGSGTQQPNGGRDTFAQGNNSLTVSGGQTVVTANGDGIDVNGSWTMTGGTVIVNGPTASNNGALDYDGTFALSGGVVLAAGSAGMAQSPSSSSTQPTVTVRLTAVQAAGTTVRVQTTAGEEIATLTPSKSYQFIVVSTPKLVNGTAYDVLVGGTKVTTSTATTTTAASTGGMGTPGAR
ncbi:MAG: carbohydrate-binding domain-containing protein [Acidimicrobiales bacterium]